MVGLGVMGPDLTLNMTADAKGLLESLGIVPERILLETFTGPCTAI
jgi:hypothetical protein